MYNFIDTNEVSSSATLPAEALNINGEYIENLIKGYRTLTVRGREALSAELDYYEMTARDGAVNKSKRYPPRTITVKYQLIARNDKEFRESYNKLGHILSVDDSKLVFNDEPDKFFVGTVTEIGEVEEGRNAVVGEFEIFCADPFKYSVTEYEAIGDENGTIVVDYNGTYKSFPKLCAEFSRENDNVGTIGKDGECGFVAFFNEDEKIIQLGNPDEHDILHIPQSTTTIVNSVFNKREDFGANTKWKQNVGITTGSDVVQSGTSGIGVQYGEFDYQRRDSYATLLENAFTNSVIYTVKAKATNRKVNSCDVILTITAKVRATLDVGTHLMASVFLNGAWKQIYVKQSEEMWNAGIAHTVNATFNVSGLTSTPTLISGIKFKVDGFEALAETICTSILINAYEAQKVNGLYLTTRDYGTGTHWHGSSITRTFENSVDCKTMYSHSFGVGYGRYGALQTGIFQALMVGSGKVIAGISIVKGGYGNTATVYFFVNGKIAYKTDVDVSCGNHWFNPNTSSMIEKIGSDIAFNINGIYKKFKDETLMSVGITSVTFLIGKYGTQEPLADNGLHYVKVIKDVKESYENIENVFTCNDNVVADCETGSIYRNGLQEQGLGALGNDWEDFYLVNGINQIGTAFSDFVTFGYEPKFKLKYREVFL